MNYDLIYAAGGAPNYVSGVELDDSSGVSTAAQLKVVGVSKDPDNNDLGASHVNFVVQINEHFYKNSTAGI
jgi:hypothetical protein